MIGQDFDVKVWSKDFEFWNLIKICVRTCFFGKQNSTLGSVVPLAMFRTIIVEDKYSSICDIYSRFLQNIEYSSFVSYYNETSIVVQIQQL